MRAIRHLAILLPALLLAGPRAVPAQTTRTVAPVAWGEARGFSMVLLLAQNKPGPPVEGLSEGELSALKDAAGLLPYKNFQKLDSAFVLGARGGTVRLQGPNGREYTGVLAAAPPTRPGVRVFYVKVDLTDGSTIGSVLKSEFEIQLDETVIVGTSRVKGTDQALILLLTAVPVMRVYKVGSGITNPVLTSETKPQYTREKLDAGIQGTVVLECVVLPDGSVGDVGVVKFLDPVLDQKAIEAARQWRFRPGTLDGKPVPVLVSIELTFTKR